MTTSLGALTLYQPRGGWGEPSMSPFCMKLECWLRLAGIAFEVRDPNFPKAPKGKIPFVRFADGSHMGDSQLILEKLTKDYGVRLDEGLSPRQLAEARMLRRALEEGTYWCAVWARWIDDDAWPSTRTAMASIMPAPVALFLPLIRRNVRKATRAQGTGRHSKADILRMAIADLEALDALIEGPFVFGETPRSIDATVYGFIEAALAHPVDGPIKKRLGELHKPRALRDAMRARLPELGKR